MPDSILVIGYAEILGIGIHFNKRYSHVRYARQAIGQLPDVCADSIASSPACIVKYEDVCHERMLFRI